MSEQDPKEHLKTYERFCAPRFQKMENEITEVRSCTSELKSVVTNGLKDDVSELKEGQRWLFRLVVGILIVVALGSAGLYWKVTQQVIKINNQVEKVHNEVSD